MWTAHENFLCIFFWIKTASTMCYNSADFIFSFGISIWTLSFSVPKEKFILQYFFANSSKRLVIWQDPGRQKLSFLQEYCKKLDETFCENIARRFYKTFSTLEPLCIAACFVLKISIYVNGPSQIFDEQFFCSSAIICFQLFNLRTARIWKLTFKLCTW